MGIGAGAIPPPINHRLGRAMHDYQMFDHGDRILIGASGGLDSLVLTWILQVWQRKAPIRFRLVVVHLDMEPDGTDPGKAAVRTRTLVETMGLACIVEPASFVPPATGIPKDCCHRCARSRRQQLFTLARKLDCTKVALGHHQDDLIETFFLNLTSGGNLSTMLPRQDLFEGRLSLVRPLAYLKKSEIIALATRIGLQETGIPCPLASRTRRSRIRTLLALVYRMFPGSREHIFAALGNVRTDYLLKPRGAVMADSGGAPAWPGGEAGTGGGFRRKEALPFHLDQEKEH